MPRKKSVVDAPRRLTDVVDLAGLAADQLCDPLDPFTHQWVETVPWHAEPGAQGEFRSLECARCGVGPHVEGRQADPKHRLPVADPFGPPEAAAS